MVLLHYRFTDLRLLLMHSCGFHAETVPANPRKKKKRFRDCSRFASICKEIRARKMSRPYLSTSNKYILLYGLSYNTRGYFASCVSSIFPSPTGARKNTSNEQNVREYYMLNHLIRDLLFRYKKVLF